MADINYAEIPETARQDILAATVKLARVAFDDPAVKARFEVWLAKRKAAEAATK